MKNAALSLPENIAPYVPNIRNIKRFNPIPRAAIVLPIAARLCGKMTLDPYLNPATGRRWRLTATERAYIADDKTTSKTLLALQFGVNPRLIDFIRNPDKYAANNEYTKAYRKKRRAENPIPRKYKKRKKAKPPPKDPYTAQIDAAIASGIGAGDIESRLNESLSILVKNRLAIEDRINEVRKTQDALYAFLDITPVTVDLEFVERKNDKIIHMTAKEMRWWLTECGLNSKRLAAELNGRYSVRAIDSYRRDEHPVPRDVAELLRGLPRKAHVEWV